MQLSIEQVVEATHGVCLNAPSKGNNIIKSICIDSRKVEEGCLFVPIKGERFDGHDYMEKIADQGGKIALTQYDQIVDERLMFIRVKDTRKALLDLAHFYLKQFDIPVIAVTGSVGKTTTKELVASVLEQKYNVHKTQGNFNNDIGLPLTVFELTQVHECVVLEMGMNHFKEIEVLSQCARPDYAVITNIGVSHIENLGSREGILQAKLEILAGLQKDGKLFVNGDDDQLQTVLGRQDTLSYGLCTDNDYYAKNVVLESERVLADVHTPKDTYNICVNSPGEHMVYNSLVAISIGEVLGLTKEQILKGLSSYKADKMRMHIEVLNGITIIDDTYNASTDSMKAAIKVLSNMQVKGKKIAVLGDMFEMGDHAKEQHEAVGSYVANQNIDVLYAVGQLSEATYHVAKMNNTIQCIHYPSKEQLIDKISSLIQEGDAVLFKASRGMQLEKLVEELRKVKQNEK